MNGRSLLRVVDIWFALSLSVGLAARVAFRHLLAGPIAAICGAGVALILTVLVVWWAPEFTSRPFWTLGLLTVGLYAFFAILLALLVGGVSESVIFTVSLGVALTYWIPSFYGELRGMSGTLQ